MKVENAGGEVYTEGGVFLLGNTYHIKYVAEESKVKNKNLIIL